MLFCAAVALANAAPTGSTVEVSVMDQGKHPIPGAAVQLYDSSRRVFSAVTDENGRARFDQLEVGHYEVNASKDGFEPVKKDDIDVSQTGVTSIELTLAPAVHHENVDVRGTASAVDQGASSPTQVAVPATQDLSNRPATVADALPLVPGVARTPGGGLQISGSGEHRSALLVNSADVTDPATGQFGSTVPIDEVQSLNVYQTPFLAEYGTFTAGVVSVETRRGGDHWMWEIKDPFPEFRIRSWDLRGLRSATPRPNFAGPLKPGKLYLSAGFLYEIKKTEVYELPFPFNQKKQEGLNSFAQLDWVVSSQQLLTATIHVAPQRLEFVNMDYFNPQTTTPDARTQSYTATIADHLSLHGGVLDNTVSATYVDARIWGQGPLDLTMTPQGNSGDYFAQQSRNAYRYGWSSTYSFGPVAWLGTHNIKTGTYVAESSVQGHVSDHPIDILGLTGQWIERIAFTEGQPYRTTDTDFAFFAQDHWNISSRLALEYGMRVESQEISEAIRVAPRAGFAWSPFAHTGMVVRGGVGLFYDRVPLNVYSLADYPEQVVTTYSSNGQVSGGPFLYLNTLGQVTIQPRLVSEEPTAGNFSPRSTTWSLQVEQPVTSFLKLRAGFIESESAGLVVMSPVAPDPSTDIGAHMLSGTGQSRYRQAELTAKVRLNAGSQLFVSYVRSRARGDLNDFNNYLGSFPVPILRPDEYGTLPTDIPNRFLAWGVFQLPWKIRIAPTVEYRSGFPYIVTDAAQNYSGSPDQNRFPGFFSADAKVSKDFKVSPKYTLRPSVSMFNLTDHFNPEAFHNNIADPAYGLFFGQRGRRFTADFDVIF